MTNSATTGIAHAVPSDELEPIAPEVFAAERELALAPDILAVFREDVRRSGYAGDTANVELVFLAVVSRLLDRPASIAIKGQSSSGKNATVEAALRFVPTRAYFARTSVSPKALFYTGESFEHRMLVLFEGHQLKEGDLAGIVRSLLSEGRLIYEFTDFESKGTEVLEKPGPTGLITTTTLLSLDRELETRLFSPNVADTPDLTRAILLAIAVHDEGRAPAVDYRPWHLLQDRLEASGGRVRVPYLEPLAELVDSSAVRMRRDFQMLVAFIKAHALLHTASRDRDGDRTVATLEDYAAVHALTAALIAHGISLSVPTKVRSTVAATGKALGTSGLHVTIRELAAELGVHESNARRRVYECLSIGALSNSSPHGRPMQISLGEPLADDRAALPTPDELRAACAHARTPGVA